MERINSLLITISTVTDWHEKMKILEEIDSLCVSLKKENEIKQKEAEKMKELEIKNRENIKLNKYKDLFERKMKEFSYVCPSCGSPCSYDTIGGHFLFLFCNNYDCNNRKRSSYDGDDTVGIDVKLCKRKIFFN